MNSLSVISLESQALAPRRARPWHAVALLLGLCCTGAGAQTAGDPPSRIARLDDAQGVVQFAAAGAGTWSPAQLNRPLTRGDRIANAPGARSQLHAGPATLRLDSGTRIDITALDDDATQLSLDAGSVVARVHSLAPGENFEVNTPNLAFRASQPGVYRIDVEAARGATGVSVLAGAGAVFGENAESVAVAPGQQLAFTGRTLTPASAAQAPANDDFARWAAARDQQDMRSDSAQYLPAEMPGFQQLDAYGTWATDPGYGAVWYPRTVAADWAPYRYGRWEWIAPWGWTWIDDAPWGFAPSHYGRWTRLGGRWGWVPGHPGPRPAYAPALVGFTGGPHGGPSWNVRGGAGQPHVGWFPLAPGEHWRPGFAASSAYVDNVNRATAAGTGTRGVASPFYVHQHRPEAITAAPGEVFQRGGRVRPGPGGAATAMGAAANPLLVATPPGGSRPAGPPATLQAPSSLPRRDPSQAFDAQARAQREAQRAQWQQRAAQERAVRAGSAARAGGPRPPGAAGHPDGGHRH